MKIELQPRLISGKIIEVTEVGAVIAVKGRLGILKIPLRFVITDKQLEIGDHVEFYMSYARVIANTGLKEEILQ